MPTMRKCASDVTMAMDPMDELATECWLSLGISTSCKFGETESRRRLVRCLTTRPIKICFEEHERAKVWKAIAMGS